MKTETLYAVTTSWKFMPDFAATCDSKIIMFVRLVCPSRHHNTGRLCATLGGSITSLWSAKPMIRLLSWRLCRECQRTLRGHNHSPPSWRCLDDICLLPRLVPRMGSGSNARSHGQLDVTSIAYLRVLASGVSKAPHWCLRVVPSARWLALLATAWEDSCKHVEAVL